MQITVVDCDAGNLLNVVRALEYCGAEVTVTNDAKKINHSERLVLPGVGAFSDCMASMHKYDLVEAVREYANSDKPLLAICVGMQMLFDSSSEFGIHEGLSIIPGTVEAIPNKIEGEKHRKIPHVGWTELDFDVDANTWLQGIEPQSSVYFVHSFMAVPAAKEHILASSNYDGQSICAAVAKGNILGCQFHPEKSGSVGLEILNNFLYH